MRPILLLLSLLLMLLGSANPAGIAGPAPSGRWQPGGSGSLAAELRALLNDSATVAGPGSRLDPAVRAFYRRRAFAPAWCAESRPGVPGQAALALLAQAADYGLLPGHYQAPTGHALADSLNNPASAGQQLARQVRFEVLLTGNLLRFVGHLRRGQLHAQTPSPLESKAAPFEPAA